MSDQPMEVRVETQDGRDVAKFQTWLRAQYREGWRLIALVEINQVETEKAWDYNYYTVVLERQRPRVRSRCQTQWSDRGQCILNAPHDDEHHKYHKKPKE